MSVDNSPVKVLVFDLNETLYLKASKDELYKFLCSKEPARLMYFFKIAYYKALKFFHLINHTEFKENFFDYLNGLPPNELYRLATEFWEREFPGKFHSGLMQHFKKMQNDGVELVCITGAFEDYVKPLFDKLFTVDYFSGTRTRYENNTYHIIGEACKGEEKLNRIKEHYKDKPYRIVEAYSDSEEKLFREAERAFLLKDGKILPYHKNNSHEY